MNTLDVRGLPDDQVQFLKELTTFLRQKHRVPTPKTKRSVRDETERIDLHSWSLGVKGELSREEIYDYLDETTNGTR